MFINRKLAAAITGGRDWTNARVKVRKANHR